MASSGQLGNTFRTGYRIQIEWTATPNIEGNYHDVVAQFYLISLGSSYTISSSVAKNLSMIIDGQTFNHSVNVSLSGNQKKLLATSTKRVWHNPDGTKNFGISGSLGINVTLSGTYYGTVSIANVNFDLDDIPRATTPSLNYSTREMGQVIRITTNPAVASFSHKVYYSFTGIGKTLIAEKPAGNQYHDWTIPLATLAPKIPNSLSGAVTIEVETYSGATLIGTRSVAFTATVPDYQPSLSLGVTGVDLYLTRYVQGKSKVAVAITADGLYGSTIATFRTVVNGSIYNTANLTTEVLALAGTNTIETTVTDSRGKTRVVTQNITVEAYTNPRATYLVALRCDANGTLNPGGSYIKATIQASISPIANTNTKQTLVKYKKKADSTWITALTNTTDYEPNQSVVFPADGNFPYDVRLEVNDYYNSGAVLRNVDVGTAFTLQDFHSGGQSMSIGKVAEGLALLEMGGEILSMANFNRGGFNAPTKGAVTQQIDESYNQHSVIVGRNASGARVYGIDLYDRTDDPIMRLYAGSKYIQISSAGLGVNGNSLKKEVLGETALILTDINRFKNRVNTLLTTSYPQLIPMQKMEGGLSIASDIITLQKGYFYEMELDILIAGNAGYTYFKVYDTSNVDLMPNGNIAITANSTTGSGICIGRATLDLSASATDKNIKVVQVYLVGTPSTDDLSGGLVIKKYKKITI